MMAVRKYRKGLSLDLGICKRELRLPQYQQRSVKLTSAIDISITGVCQCFGSVKNRLFTSIASVVSGGGQTSKAAIPQMRPIDSK
jgi:hypothetical protein